MSDILIRMEMPQNCVDCYDADLSTAIALFGAKCPFAHGIIDPGVYDLCHERHPDCPLHELPPHGDLISRDDLYKIMETYTDYGGSTEPHDENQIHRDSILFAIENAPVIIPAEKGE